MGKTLKKEIIMRGKSLDMDLLEEFQTLMGQNQEEKALRLFSKMPEEKWPALILFAKSLNDLLQNQPQAALRWRDQLDQIARRNDAKPLLTTFDTGKKGFNFNEIQQHLVSVGDTPGVFKPRLLSLVTVGEQTCAYSFKDLTATRGVVLHLLIAVRSNLRDNFYVKFLFEDPEEVETIRLGNNSVTLCKDASCYIISNKGFGQLYTFVIEEGWVKVYYNGFLRLRKKRTCKSRPFGLTFEVMGEKKASVRTMIQGIELWSFDKEFKEMFDDEDKLLQHQVKYLIKHENTQRLYELLNSIGDISLASVEKDSLELMQRMVSRQGGVKEWILEEVYNNLSTKSKQKWHKTITNLIPSPAIEVENLTVTFSQNPSTDLSLIRLLSGKKKKLFDALRDINFRVYPRDIIGIIGRNGAGKSTLLKTIAGLIPIRKGRVFVRGRSILLRPGMGMRMEMTGRENIAAAGVYMQLLPKEVEEITEDIIEFSELGDSIDRPYKFYSDGMKRRLVFSIATGISPEILMLDELLSAGDISFRSKATERLDKFIESAKVVIVVTHGLNFVRDHCNKALYLSQGKQVYFGAPEIAISSYLNQLHMLPENRMSDIDETTEACLINDSVDIDNH